MPYLIHPKVVRVGAVSSVGGDDAVKRYRASLIPIDRITSIGNVGTQITGNTSR